MATLPITTFDGPGVTSEEFGAVPGTLTAEFINDTNFIGTIVLERKDTHGLNEWVQVSRGGVAASWNTSFVELLSEPTQYARYRLRCASYSSGSGRGTISQI